MTQLEKIFEVSQVDSPPAVHGILQTKNYHDFIIFSDIGDIIHTFTGSVLANTCLPGDHVSFTDRCELELRYEHPLIVGTLELSSKSTYGLTKRGHPMYLFTPYNASYPHFIVGCSEKDTSKNRVVVIKFGDWVSKATRSEGTSGSFTFPRGLLERNLGVSGEFQAEYKALIWQACPYYYPEYTYELKRKDTSRQIVEGYTFNIDPEGCKDIDDVFTFKKVEDGWLVTITISDVAAYVEDGSAIDIMASLIGQTLYDQGMIIKPMLPLAYQNECSLLPLKTSYGISMQFLWNKHISDIKWFESIIENNRSFTYEEFQRNPIYPLQELASYLAEDSHPIVNLEDSHKWVEQMMLFYNKEAGKLLKQSGMGILRRHSAPDQERLEKYRTHMPEFEHFAFSSAEYCLADEINTSHYGLNTDAYAHASSPIRRYADLVNQRVLKLLLQESKEIYYVPLTMYDMKQREKGIKHFARDVDFLKAITSGSSFTGIIMDTIPKEDRIKVKIYVHEWKRMVSVYYKIVDGQILSRDQKTDLDVSLYRSVNIECAVIPNARNWKERIVIHIL